MDTTDLRSNVTHLKYFVRKSSVYISYFVFVIMMFIISMLSIKIDIMQQTDVYLISISDNKYNISFDIGPYDLANYICLYENKNNVTYRIDLFKDEQGYYVIDLEVELAEKIDANAISVKAEIPIRQKSLLEYIFVNGGKNH